MVLRMYTGAGPVDGWLCATCDAPHADELEQIDDQAARREHLRELEYDRQEECGLDRWRGLDDGDGP